MPQELAPSVTKTAAWMAAERAIESKRPDALIRDPLAEYFATGEGWQVYKRFGIGGPNAFVPIRAKFFDEFLKDSVLSRGVRQIVILGAGYDARAYRLNWPEGTVLFEVDHPQLIARKQEILSRVRVAPRCDRRVVGIDLAGSWEQALLNEGFDPNLPTSWVGEGLLLYLEDESAAHLMQTARKLSHESSRFALDIVDEDVLQDKVSQVDLKIMRKAGMFWTFGTGEPELFLSQCGWKADLVVQPGEEGANFRKLAVEPVPRDEHGPSRAFYIVASAASASAIAPVPEPESQEVVADPA